MNLVSFFHKYKNEALKSQADASAYRDGHRAEFKGLSAFFEEITRVKAFAGLSAKLLATEDRHMRCLRFAKWVEGGEPASGAEMEDNGYLRKLFAALEGLSSQWPDLDLASFRGGAEAEDFAGYGLIVYSESGPEAASISKCLSLLLNIKVAGISAPLSRERALHQLPVLAVTSSPNDPLCNRADGQFIVIVRPVLLPQIIKAAVSVGALPRDKQG